MEKVTIRIDESQLQKIRDMDLGHGMSLQMRINICMEAGIEALSNRGFTLKSIKKTEVEPPKQEVKKKPKKEFKYPESVRTLEAAIAYDKEHRQDAPAEAESDDDTPEQQRANNERRGLGSRTNAEIENDIAERLAGIPGYDE